MANEVYANGMELACKAGAGKVIASFPDVCFTPPENPATPPGVPVPYPNTGSASDTTEGSKNVKISGQEVMLKNQSYFKTSVGDEAGCAAKKGVISSQNKGKVYFIKWSMDVKFEGENVDRHFDMTTNNHGSPMANEAIPWAFVDKMKVDGHSCKKVTQKIHPYGKKKCNRDNDEQSHHIIDNASLTMEGARGTNLKDIMSTASGRGKRNLFQPGSGHPGEDYDEKKAPCICLKGDMAITGTEHNIAHAHTEDAASRLSTSDGKWSYKHARDEGAKSIQQSLNLKDWEVECIKFVLDAYFQMSDDTEMKAPGQDCPATHFNDGAGKMCHASELV